MKRLEEEEQEDKGEEEEKEAGRGKKKEERRGREEEEKERERRKGGGGKGGGAEAQGRTHLKGKTESHTKENKLLGKKKKKIKSLDVRQPRESNNVLNGNTLQDLFSS